MIVGDDPEFEPQTNWRGETRPRLRFYQRAWFSVLAALVVLAGVAAVIGYSIMVQPLKEEADQFDLRELQKLESASILYDRNGEELSRLFVLNRTPVAIKEVPQHFIDALTAQEDSRFFQHSGVDYIGIIRAMWLNFRAGGETQGASTITQQLARQTFNLKEKNYQRKIKEAFVANRVEKQFSKSEILELYLNRIYFGGGFYGVQAAAQGYFGKDARDLSIEESATICGLIKSPNNIQPLRHPDRAIKERNYVLDRMVIEGTLSQAEAIRLQQKPMITAPRLSDPRLSYVFEEVRQEVMALMGDERAAVGGFRIYTSIDKDLQQAAEESVKARLADVEKRAGYEHQTYEQFKVIFTDYRTKLAKGLLAADAPRPKPEYLQGSALVMDNRDGSVLAMVGGRDFVDSQYNRVTDGSRPVGTAFIPFVYATAFSQPGFFPGTQLEDAPLDNRRVMIGGLTGILGEWGAEVDNPKWSQAQISAREAIVHSHNSATVRMGERLGRTVEEQVNAVKAVATKAGITTPLRDYPSSFLGASEAKLDEMCLAYSCFPTLGKRPAKVHIIQRITDSDDNTVFQIDEASLQPVRGMDEIAAYQVHTCLQESLRRGTGSVAAEYGLGDYPAAGKTGTHYEFKDLWFLGYTSAVTCGVWVGFDKQKTIYQGAFSNRIALPIWTDVMNAAAKGTTPQEVPPPESAEKIEVCRNSGLRATDFCYEKVKDAEGRERSMRNTYFEYLRPGTSFNASCTFHTGDGLPMDLAAFHQMAPAGTDSTLVVDAGKFAHIEPVRMQDLTILGVDPYDAEQPILRAKPVNDDGTPIRRAVPVGPADGAPVEEEVPVLKLKPPPPLKIDF